MSDSKNQKDDILHVETSPHARKPGESSHSAKHADRAADLVTSGERPIVTEADSKRIRRKTDKSILVILIWVYFLQILDKSVLGYGATFGLQKDTGLTGNQYSLIGSIAPIAQLAWQPFSSYLIVRVPHRILMPVLCLGWGIAQASMAACHNFSSLMAARFFLGLFEAGCLPLFSVITSQWYRRAEQPVRVAAWYGTNGLATIVAAGLSDGLAHIKSDVLKPWQIIFLFVGLLTIVSVPFIYWKLDNDIPSARFLTEEEKPMAVERLRANQTGTGSREFKVKHVLEAFIEPKTWLWIGMSMLLNVGASVSNTFGPLILSGLGFDAYTTSLLNMPFGVMQLLVILLASFLAQKARLKGAVLALLMLPVVAGLAVLYAVPRTGNQGPLLVGYYLLAFLFGGNPLIVTWIVGNTAGTTKKSFVVSAYNAASSAGNIVGPLLFNKKDSPAYHPGLRACLGIFIALVAVILLQWANLVFLNKLQEKKRVRNGKPAKMIDHSMQDQYHDFEENNSDAIIEMGAAEHDTATAKPQERIGEQAFLDMTDRDNDEFVYIY
ncbi:putative MFS transporter [Talaromyces proteolyticus]|uniref:MFS transporter n=1 Tax=Talaromyces proteolyticus TaxID=1131652 RepID=A0AAD4PTQ5_9EURO|nr:putative MFS transporter [Talaromyces proteolyticus]KAH8689089.1 putative MFS transporter [Talaromyces proteolyticus]